MHALETIKTATCRNSTKNKIKNSRKKRTNPTAEQQQQTQR